MRKNVLTRVLSMFLALVMVLLMIPATVVTAFAKSAPTGVPEELVDALTEILGGDEERARKSLQALYDAGLIDENGNMVDLDIREDGKSVDLVDLADRISSGEKVGDITVNGNETTPEKILQLRQVSSMLEVIHLIDRDVEITDEHIANLESLIEGIADGSIDLSDIIDGGKVDLNAKGGALRGTSRAETLPANQGTGEAEATDGRYTAPYISGSEYNQNYSFSLLDPDNTTWYTERTAPDGVVTLSCNETASVGSTFTVTATLNKVQSVAVSFDWKAVSDVLNLTGTTSGTVTWEANDTQLTKTFSFGVNKKSNWYGSQCFVINAGNAKNATFGDGKTVWSQTVQVIRNSDADRNAVTNEYPTHNYSYGFSSVKVGDDQYNWAVIDQLPAAGDRFIISFSWLAQDSASMWVVDPSSFTPSASSFSNFGSANRYRIGRGGESPYQRSTTLTEKDTNVANKVKDGKLILVYQHNWEMGGFCYISGVSLKVPYVVAIDEVVGVSAPAGTYYSGQVVPVTVTLKEHAIATAGTTLTVNGVECPMLNDPNTEAKTFTFAYTVKETDTGAINVTELSDTFVNGYGDKVDFETAFPPASIGADEGVALSPDVKAVGLDWDNVKYGIDDAAPGQQVVTVVVPFKADANKTWIVNETEEINPALDMAVPGYPNATAAGYLRSAYFSADGGTTRYPVYVIGENADVLVARFAAPVNATSYLRLDNLCLYLDPLLGTTAEYFGTEHTDAKGYSYFTATENTARAAMGKSVSYYVRASVLFDSSETVARLGYDEANIMKNAAGDLLGLYKDGTKYIVVQNGNYDRQYDVELWVNEALYTAISEGIRSEDSETLILNYQFSGRRDFTFTGVEQFSWTSSDKKIAKVVKDEATGTAQILLNGVGGEVTLTLTVGNGANRNAYDISFTITVLEGKSPFLSIPDFSKERTTLTEIDTDVLFSSNVTARNAVLEKNTVFTAKLYRVSAVGEVPSGDPIWTGEFESTEKDPLTHVTVPGDRIEEAGIYAVVVGTRYEGGIVDGVMTNAEDLSATAYLRVKQAPLKVTLNQLDSYSADYQNLPTIEYTIKPANASANAVVEYTIQKSGEAVSERRSASGGVIPFTATKPEGLKDAYTITVYARSADASADEAWSVDSMLLRVYNMDVLELVVSDVLRGEIGGTTGGVGENANGTTVEMDNHDKLEDYGITGDSYQLTVSDLNALRTDMSLQKLISANYGSGIWGLLSDKMQWTSSDSDLVSINYKQGGIYSDINNYSYTSYGPATDFLLVGKGDTDGVTITATHAGTGATASITVAAHTLTNQLYIFQFFPKVETDVIYTNGDGVKRTLKSDENGVLAVYEPAGIGSAVMAMSKVGGETYVGTIFANRLESGERDIASLQLYPTNNLRLRSVSGATLTFLNPDGSVYNGTVSLRVGVYKNGVYCPDAKVFLAGDSEGRNGREDVIAEVVDGKLTLGFDPTSFKNDPDDAEETGAYPGDRIAYVIEYRVGDYETGYTIINAVTDIQGEQDPMDSVIELKTVKGGGNAPQIIRQTIQQYTDNKPVAYTRDVINYTENIGLSNKFNKVVLTTDFVLPSSTLSLDANGHTVLRGDFAFYTVDGRKLTGQTDYSVSPAVTIENLADLSGAELFVFPFSAAAFGRLVYTMTDDNMKADGITDEGENPPATARIKLMFVRDGMAVTSLVMPFGVANLSHQQDLTDENGPAKDTATDIQGELSGKMSIGDIFNSINVNDMLKKGFAFLGGLSTGGDVPLRLMIIPTENPGVFRIVAFVGSKPAGGDENDLTIDYNSEAMYEALTVDDKGGDDDDDDDDDDSGEVKYSASFSGTIILEAGYDISAKKWTIDFIGGSVGLGFSIKYEWSQNFLAGPVPVNISFEVGAHAELEVSFANKSTVKLMLVDATIGVSIEAFAGIGFDSSIATLKLGIYGSIGADVNFLMLTDFRKDTSTGTKLTINGEIGIRFEIKVLFIKYKTTLASTSFNWTRKWNRYDEIRQKWENDGFADLTGYTRSGRAYVMRLMSDGSALVAIESGGELEDRDYLELGERAWNSGIPSGRRLLKSTASKPNALTNVQTNAYPYSNPVFVDDGSMFLYISDNDNADELQNVVSYAVSNGIGYDNMGPLYPTDGENAVLADSDVVASGTGSNVFAAWVKQSESLEKEMNDKTNYDDLGMMMNATEIYVGAYNGTAWTTTRLTDNSVADMAPTIASRGSKAIAAWRSLSATQMPENGGGQDFTAMFDAENNINYSVYDGTKWADAKVAYNGSAGTVTAINSAMLADGTSILVYTVRTGDDVTTTETYYTVIDADGNAVTTGRLTSDEYIDTNAQVAAVGDRFVVGWYSEHDTGVKTVDPDTGDEQNVTAHDIRLACIHANGSVDESFPESIGGGSATGITSDFRFSAPADIDELSKLSIVWSQAKDSEDEADDGKYELNAVRFYEKDGYIGVTSPITIAETDKNFTVDHFDTYTDEEGKVHVLVLGSDYNSLEGLAEYDTIDLSNQPIETGDGSQLLTILDQNPLAYIKLGAGEFSETAIEVKAGTNLKELVPGIDLPVQFTVRNTGVGTVEKVTVQLGDVNKTVEGLSLLPGQSATVSVMYPIPEGAVSDVAFTVTADDAATVDGTLILNRPDVGITGMKVVREENGERDIRVVLSNQSGIPLAGSGKTVKLAFYRDSEFSRQIGETVTIPADGYADIDDDVFVYNQTLRVEDLIDGAKEIPDSGIRVYAKAWVEEENGEPINELYSNNTGSVFFKGLLTRNNGRKITSDTFVEISESGYTVSADIRNNSLQPVEVGVPVAVLLDAEGHVIAQKNLSIDVLHLGTEERRNGLSVAFAADEVEALRQVRRFALSAPSHTRCATAAANLPMPTPTSTVMRLSRKANRRLRKATRPCTSRVGSRHRRVASRSQMNIRIPRTPRSTHNTGITGTSLRLHRVETTPLSPPA